MNTFKDALKNIQDSKKIGVWDLMLVVPCSNTNRAMKLLILGVGFCAWFQNFKLVKYLLCSFVSDCWISETKKNLKWNFLMKKNLVSLCLLGMWLFSGTKSLFKFWVPFPEILPAIEFAQFAMYSCFSKAKINVIYIFTNMSLNNVHFFLQILSVKK